MSNDDCGISVNLTQVPPSSHPLHIVMWKGKEEDNAIQKLLDRITALESMVSGLIETQKSSLWFPPSLRPTPTGIDIVSRRESGVNEADIETVLSQLVRPSETRKKVEAEAEAEAEVEAEGQVEAEAEAEGQVDEQVEEEVEAEVEVEVEAEAEAEVEAEVEEAKAEPEAKVEEVEVEEFEEEVEIEVEEEVEEGEEGEEIVEYREIEWKGKTYYIDGQGEAYEMDSDGDLIDTPVGAWREEQKKLVKYAKM